MEEGPAGQAVQEDRHADQGHDRVDGAQVSGMEEEGEEGGDLWGLLRGR